MKAFRFSLRTLLNAREAIQEALAFRLAERRRSVELQTQRLRALQDCRRNHLGNISALHGGTVPARELARDLGYLQWMDQEIARTAHRARECTRETDAARHQWLKARSVCSVLHCLRNRERAAWAAGQNREEQKTLDDQILSAWNQRRTRSPEDT